MKNTVLMLTFLYSQLKTSVSIPNMQFPKAEPTFIYPNLCTQKFYTDFLNSYVDLRYDWPADESCATFHKLECYDTSRLRIGFIINIKRRRPWGTIALVCKPNFGKSTISQTLRSAKKQQYKELSPNKYGKLSVLTNS